MGYILIIWQLICFTIHLYNFKAVLFSHSVTRSAIAKVGFLLLYHVLSKSCALISPNTSAAVNHVAHCDMRTVGHCKVSELVFLVAVCLRC